MGYSRRVTQSNTTERIGHPCGMKRGREISGVSSYKGTNLIMSAQHL